MREWEWLALVGVVVVGLLVALYRIVERVGEPPSPPAEGGGGVWPPLQPGPGVEVIRPLPPTRPLGGIPILLLRGEGGCGADGTGGSLVIRDFMGGCVLGRDPATADVVVENNTVSARHARVTWKWGQGHDREFWVEDLNSISGTRVNDKKIGLFRRESIAAGDTVQVGEVTLNVERCTGEESRSKRERAILSTYLVGRGTGEGTDRIYDGYVRLGDDTVSAVHAEVVLTGKGVHVADRGSRNGTFMFRNGTWMRNGIRQAVFDSRDRVAFGECEMSVATLRSLLDDERATATIVERRQRGDGRVVGGPEQDGTGAVGGKVFVGGKIVELDGG